MSFKPYVLPTFDNEPIHFQMKSTLLKYGLYALVAGFLLFGAPFLFGMDVGFDYGEVLGYSAMILSLLFVYFGIKHYRDKENGGRVTFGRAIGLGMLIALFAAVGVAIFDYLYTTQINPDFATEYLEQSLVKMEKTLSPEEYKTKSAELTTQMTEYGGSGFMAFLMFASVMIIGFIMSLISGLILQRKKQ